MSGHKVMSMEPTAEMVEAAEEAYMPFGDMDLAIRMALLTAPDAQGEAVGVLDEDGEGLYARIGADDLERTGAKIGDPVYLRAPTPASKVPEVGDTAKRRAMLFLDGLDHQNCKEVATLRACLAATPQPAEQQPTAGDSLTSVPDEVFAAEFSAWWEDHGQFCRAGGGTYERSFAFEAWRHLYPQLMNLQMAAAEPQPELVKYQPCGCVICTCEHETQCQGCGARHCGTHPVGQFLGPVYQQPAPDVSALVGALESILNGSPLDAWGNRDDDGISSAISMGIQRDSLQRWRKIARQALSAYRKQGGEV